MAFSKVLQCLDSATRSVSLVSTEAASDYYQYYFKFVFQ